MKVKGKNLNFMLSNLLTLIHLICPVPIAAWHAPMLQQLAGVLGIAYKMKGGIIFVTLYRVKYFKNCCGDDLQRSNI